MSGPVTPAGPELRWIAPAAPADTNGTARVGAAGSRLYRFRGVSMLPLLRDGDVLETVAAAVVAVGDIIVCAPAGDPRLHVHRVVRVTPAGVVTQGDNNPQPDPWALPAGQVLGRVAVRRRGRCGRRLARGRLVLAAARLANRVYRVRARGCRLLHRPYRLLARRLAPWRLLPAAWRPRRIVFLPPPAGPCLLWGRLLIGRYDTRTARWDIRRPFRLCIPPALLHWPPA